MTPPAADDVDRHASGGGAGEGGSEPRRDETYVIERPATPAGPGQHDEGAAASAAGAELYVERVGPPGARTVYYLHGGPGYNAYSFRELVGDDLDGFDVIYADQRGGGRSYGAGSPSVVTLAQDVVAVLDALGVDRATLLAHGFGAAVAVRTAALRPDLIDGVVLVNPWLSLPLLARALHDEATGQTTRAFHPGEAQQTAPGDDTTAEAGPAADPQWLVDEAFSLVNPKVLFDAMQFPSAAGRLRLEHVDAVALTGDLADEVPPGVWSIDELDTLAELEAAGTSVVVLSGSRDRTSYPAQAEQALLRSPSALFSQLDTGHYPWIDDPEAFAELLQAALGGASARA